MDVGKGRDRREREWNGKRENRMEGEEGWNGRKTELQTEGEKGEGLGWRG